MPNCIPGFLLKNKTDNGKSEVSDINSLVKKALVSEKRGCIYGNCVGGTGIFVYDDGSVYSGNFNKARRQGAGKMFFRDGGHFAGMYFEDLKEGRGTFYFSNGDRLEAGFTDGNPEGEGIYYFLDGRIFRGLFSENGVFFEGVLKDGSDIKKCSVRETAVVCEN